MIGKVRQKKHLWLPWRDCVKRNFDAAGRCGSFVVGSEWSWNVSDTETLILVDVGRILSAWFQKRMSAVLVALISWSRRLMLSKWRCIDSGWTRRSDGSAWFFKRTSPLENRSVNTTKRRKLSSWPSGLTWKSVKKEHSLLLWCYWCTHINDANLKQLHFIAGLFSPASAICLRTARCSRSRTQACQG